MPATPVLELQGRVDVNQARTLHAEALALCATVGDVVLDWSRVESLDGSALQILVALQRTLTAAGRRLTVTEPPEAVVRTLALTGLSPLFEAP